MGKTIIILLLVLLALSTVGVAINYEFLYNPYTGKRDRSIQLNQSGNNITADYFIGNGSLLTSVPYTNTWNTSQDMINAVNNTGIKVANATFADDSSQLGGQDATYYLDNTDTWNTSLEMIAAVNNTGIKVANATYADDSSLFGGNTVDYYLDGKVGDDIYLYNNTVTMFFNETKLNKTINASNIRWVQLISYPVACPVQSYITQLGNSVICTSAAGSHNSTSWSRSGTYVFLNNIGDNVGIGTTDPKATLTIAGSDGAINTGVIMNGTKPTFKMLEHDGNANENWQIRVDAGSLHFQKNNDLFSSLTNRMTILTGGNVGIGTITPTMSLEIANNANEGINLSGGNGLIYFDTGYGVIRSKDSFYFDIDHSNSGAKKLYFRGNANTVQIMTLEDTGNVGIGTTGPVHKLEVAGTGYVSGNFGVGAGASNPSIPFAIATTNPRFDFNDTDGVTWRFNGNANEFVIQEKTAGGAPTPFKIESGASSNTLLIDSVGVGIGTATPNSKLHVIGELNVSGISGDGSGKVVCVKSDGNLGTCSDAPAGDGTCTCG